MAPIKFDLLRPDDLLNLQIEGDNLQLDTAKPDNPALVLQDAKQPGYLIVTFPPQTIVEQAFYESSTTDPPQREGGKSSPYDTVHPADGSPTVPVLSRIGGSSRLVFRIPAGSKNRIPYTIEDLIDWTGLDLNVSTLADVPPTPTPQQRQDAPGIQPPAAQETAIELPYRLVLSPNHSVVWENARQPKTYQGITELWHTRLALKGPKGEAIELSRFQPAPLRAIWSPDFNASKFWATDPPVFGDNDADWNDPRISPPPDPNVLTAMTPSDRHELVVLTSAFHGYVRDKDDFTDYEPQPVFAEQLMLSPLGGWLKSRGEWDPPAPFMPIFIIHPGNQKKWDAYLKDFSKLSTIASLKRKAPPAGLLSAAAELAAPAAIDRPGLGGSGVLIGAGVDRISAGNLGSILWPGLLGFTGDLLNMSEWTHIATQGRDHYVRIVYEGHLYPFGHRASLIKVTERKIRDVPMPDGSTAPLAYLVQHMFIVVRQPLKDFTLPEVQAQLEDGGRGLPFKSIRLTTLVTPDIANPKNPAPSSLIPGTTYSFWVRLGSGASKADDFKFHGVAEDIAGNHIDFTASLIFIPFGEGQPGRNQVFTKYLGSDDDQRAVDVPGQKVTYAPAAGPGNENTNLTTNHLYFKTQAAPMNKRFGGFLPKLFMTSVKLPAVEALLGKPAETQVAFHPLYLSNDPGNLTGLFAYIVKETSLGVLDPDKLRSDFDAKQAGGFAQPNLSISGLTNQLGPLAGDLGKAATDTFDPGDFFGDVGDSAKLFGTLKLTDLLKPLTMTAGAPKVQLNKENIAVPPPAVKFKLVTTLDWTPEVGPLNFGIVTFHPDRNGVKAKLDVHGRVEKIIELPPPASPDPGNAKMEGTLTDFRIELLNVVEVLFAKFAFASQTGKKMDITVDLDNDTPVRFIGDLQFVEKLREAIPPGLFGDGPSLDINLTRVKAGFSITLPPVSVGVFSLKDVTLGAFLELPFIEGKPLFDFSFSSREHPFNLTVAFLGGGGFFHLQIDTLGVKMLEAALEFGASASIDLGVASGGVHIMAGIYFSMQRVTINGSDVDAATLEGYLRMGGELSILGLISLSLEFYLCFAYEITKNAAYGRATLTVKVEVLFFSKSIEITVEKRFGGTDGDPYFLDTFNAPAVWDAYAGAFA